MTGPGSLPTLLIEDLPDRRVEIAEPVGLQPVGENTEQQMPRHMRRRLPPEQPLPASAQTLEIETAQVRDLDLKLG